MQTKIEMVLQSRKFWAVVFVVAATLGLYGLGQIDATQLVQTLTIAASVYAGSVAVEDGLSAALIMWVRGLPRPEAGAPERAWEDEWADASGDDGQIPL